MSNETLRLALPSKGRIEESTRLFFERVGFPIQRPTARQYVGSLRGIPHVSVLFQRASDIVTKVESGLADIGITGLDFVAEHQDEGDAVIVLMPDLGFSRCRFVIEVPEAWVDITTIADLADLAADFRARGRTLRVITDSPNLVKDFLYAHGVTYFVVIEGEGGLEAAPAIDTADIVADRTETGTTLRDNRLKEVEGGTIMETQACLIGNRRELRASPAKREHLRQIMEFAEAHLRSRRFRTLTANVRGESASEVAAHVIQQVETAGTLGPTVAPVFPKTPQVASAHAGSVITALETGWYAVSIVVEEELLLPAIDHLRRAGSGGITVGAPEYVFEPISQAYIAMLAALGLQHEIAT
ncbi:MAG: ATP phosphoribosyltransferase [Thermomicrobiales bacterium]